MMEMVTRFSLHFTLGLHFLSGLQSAVRSLRFTPGSLFSSDTIFESQALVLYSYKQTKELSFCLVSHVIKKIITVNPKRLAISVFTTYVKNNVYGLFNFLYSELNMLLNPDKQRANELRREFQKGFDGIAKRIWPNLTHVHGVVSGKVMFDSNFKTILSFTPNKTCCIMINEEWW